MRSTYWFSGPASGAGLALAALLASATQPEPAPVRVVDARTHQPVPCASLGVPGRPLGTVADAQGRFQPAQTGAAPTDTLVVSCVGYQPRRLVRAALQQLPELPLEPQAQALGEAVVKGASWKRRRVGREAGGGFVFFNFHTQADTVPAVKLGREGGVILQVRPHSFIEDAHVFIRQWHYQSLRFRLNMRAVAADNHPAARLLTQDVQFTVPDSTSGWQHLDLRPYNVNVGPEHRVAVTLEWLAGHLADLARRRGAGRVLGHPSYGAPPQIRRCLAGRAREPELVHHHGQPGLRGIGAAIARNIPLP